MRNNMSNKMSKRCLIQDTEHKVCYTNLYKALQFLDHFFCTASNKMLVGITLHLSWIIRNAKCTQI